MYSFVQEEIKSRLKSGNACYHSVQNLLSSSLLSKNLKNKIYRTIILSVVYGCETWSLTFKEEHRLRVFENSVMRRIFGPRRDGVRGSREKYIMRSLMICSHPYFLGDQIEKNETGGAFSTYGGEERCILCFGGETLGKETTWKIQA